MRGETDEFCLTAGSQSSKRCIRADAEERDMGLPKVVSGDKRGPAPNKWRPREKKLPRQRDALTADRRRLPMVKIDKEYVFEGPDGTASLVELFDGRDQLIVCHFMFDPSWEDGCPSCTAGADEMSPGLLAHLHAR